jgi:hypothetical protein
VTLADVGREEDRDIGELGTRLQLRLHLGEPLQLSSQLLLLLGAELSAVDHELPAVLLGMQTRRAWRDVAVVV